jgi:DNA-binding response OmpR family regulator
LKASVKTMSKILLIDDDRNLSEAISLMLEREQYTPILAADAETGFEKARSLKPELLLVDPRLPGMGGADLCRQLRASNIEAPIIVLSGVADEMEKVLLLEIGADDYMVKPFSVRELLARIRALLRRSSTPPQKVIRFGDVEVDLERRVIQRQGAEVKTTRLEYELLTFFLHNVDRPLTRDMILSTVWGFESYPNTRTVDAHVGRLRQKLEPSPNAPRHLLTVHGLGYRFVT